MFQNAYVLSVVLGAHIRVLKGGVSGWVTKIVAVVVHMLHQLNIVYIECTLTYTVVKLRCPALTMEESVSYVGFTMLMLISCNSVKVC
jgi:hypothetical protein